MAVGIKCESYSLFNGKLLFKKHTIQIIMHNNLNNIDMIQIIMRFKLLCNTGICKYYEEIN